jgi:putative transposase
VFKIEAIERGFFGKTPALRLSWLAASKLFNPNQGKRYASIAYRQKLAEYDVTISMSRPGNPFDNAKVESFMKTLKIEEINGKAFADISAARRRSARTNNAVVRFR